MLHEIKHSGIYQTTSDKAEKGYWALWKFEPDFGHWYLYVDNEGEGSGQQ